MPAVFDVASVRDHTPGCTDSAFLLSAGSSLPTHRTLDATIGHLRRESEIGGYAAADEVTDVLTKGRADLATLVCGQPHEIASATSDSSAWIKAWWGWVVGGNVPSGTTVLVDRLSYHSHYAALIQTQQFNKFVIEEMPSLPDGTIDIEHLVIGTNITVVCATMIGTHSGNINPTAEVGAVAAAAGVPLFVDGCQALGQLHVDVRALGCQVFTGTGRKWLRAPRGTGMVWVAEELVERFQPPGIDGTSSDWTVEGGFVVNPGMGRFEEFEKSVAAQVGLAHAAAQAVDIGMYAIEQQVMKLATYLRTGLALLPGVVSHDTATHTCAIVTFSVAGHEPTAVVAAAAAQQISINTSTANWAALDMHAKGLTQVVRASPHYFNTEEELDRLLTVVSRLT